MDNLDSAILTYTRNSKALTMNLPLIEGKTFTNEIIWLDFADYQNCTFENCTIIVEYGVLKLTGNHFELSKIIAPEGSPANAVLALDRLLRGPTIPTDGR